jgi:hypothetical protein
VKEGGFVSPGSRAFYVLSFREAVLEWQGEARRGSPMVNDRSPASTSTVAIQGTVVKECTRALNVHQARTGIWGGRLAQCLPIVALLGHEGGVCPADEGCEPN